MLSTVFSKYIYVLYRDKILLERTKFMKDKKDYLFEDFPEFKVTEEIRNDVIQNPQKYSKCDVRIRMGKFYTDEEYQRKIEESLSRELPGQKKLCKRRSKRK